MSGNGTDRFSESASGRLSVPRRRLLYALGVGAMAGLAGCSDGQGSGDGGDGSGPGAGEDVESVTINGIERYEVSPVIERPSPPVPLDAQYQRYSLRDRPQWDGMMQFGLVERSLEDLEFYGMLIDSWEYRPGELEFTLHEDFYYWDGSPIDADNVLLHWELEDFVEGGSDRDAHPAVAAIEKTGDRSIRMELAEEWREAYALLRSIEGWTPRGATEYYQPWLERFRDASSQDEVDLLIADIDQETESDPAPFNYGPFEVVDLTEQRWNLSLRVDADPTPHFVDEINYLGFEIKTTAETAAGAMQPTRQGLFADQQQPYGDADEFDPDGLGFETAPAEFFPISSGWSILMNCSEPPFSNPHFRRAINFMTDRQRLARASGVVHNEVHAPFISPHRRDRFLGRELLDGLEDFGWNEVRQEDADRELERGGFERNSDGAILFAEGDRAGEPMEFTLTAYPWQTNVENRARADFQGYMDEWGLDIAVDLDDEHWDRINSDFEYDIAAANWGGGLPEVTLATSFGTTVAFGAGSPQFPETVEAPPVGEPWSEYDGELETYRVASTIDALSTAQDDDAYQRDVDRLAWAFNQLTPRFGIETETWRYLINDTVYDVKRPEEHPGLWTRRPHNRIWNTGALEFVPPDAR